ncbi:signal transducer and activator of transcription 6 isoform X3 [Betta splendens]|uniref:Signal transducer and activator of transcription n=1 Tax=Betta splendens TaxID=158456 RepID=A0A8M1HGX8_BETSP|nr:signal transducer and activator of transcription 6 isoform X3 [Betta splendens]
MNVRLPSTTSQQPSVIMAQWTRMSQIIPVLSYDTINSLYPVSTFPIEARHYLSEWIESQRWDDFTLEKMEQEGQAGFLLDQTISLLQHVALQSANVVDRMKLMQISRNMTSLKHSPLRFAVMIRDILRKERVLMSSPTPAFQAPPNQLPMVQDLEDLSAKVAKVQEIRQQTHQVQEELNWQYDKVENPHEPKTAEMKSQIQKLEFIVESAARERVALLKTCVDCLDRCQNQLITRLKDWRLEQYKASIGCPFDDNLNTLQSGCEQLLEYNGRLRQELMLTGDLGPEHERLEQLLHILVQSSLVVDKQPPQVIKTQSKFSSTVRYLLGQKVVPGKPVVLKAQIINELQARNLDSVPGCSDNVGELINNNAILEHNSATKSTLATFRNMSIRRIKRADRKGSESVTEEKFAILFTTEINITGCSSPYKIQMISLPVVVIVHGSQDINALATIIWDCAFSERDRVPFVVPERVPWALMCSTLNSKFSSEVQTDHSLDQYNQLFLAQKIFDKPDFIDDFSKMMVSWTQFNKDPLPGRQFTFWMWFEGAMELTKKHLRTYWSSGVIFGFIGKQHLHLILKDRPNGTFLLRFSDSEIGGITIAYVSATENGGQIIQNIQPFTKRDLEIRSLGDRIRDINHITYLYPEFPKDDVFKQFYTAEHQPLPPGGYIPATLHTIVGTDPGSDTPNACPPAMTPMAVNPVQTLQPFSPQESIAPQDMDTGPDVFRPVIPADLDLDSILETLNAGENCLDTKQ